VLLRILSFALLGATLLCAAAQQVTQAPPQVKVNVLNVCTPSNEEQKEIAAALARIPTQPVFTSDFEVARGRSTLSNNDVLSAAQSPGDSAQPLTAAWVRMRRDFSPSTPFSNVQYSFSKDSERMIETLVLHLRESKDLAQVSVEDSASAVAPASAMLGSSTPISRIRLERFGKSSIVLARCSSSQNGPPPDQTAYEPLFRDASRVMDRFRTLLRARQTVPEELAKVASSPPRSAANPPVAQRKKGPR
jgi:hypothetical protein